MRRRVDARDVLDADATTSRGFEGRVKAVFRRTGPDTWDDYELVPRDGPVVEVYAGTPVQVEDEGPVVRLRRAGEVVQVEWVPEEPVEAGADVRRRFVETCLHRDDPTPDGNLGLWLHGELNRKPDVSD